MKSRFTTLDLQAVLAELAKCDAYGLRVVNVYDIDNKTYLIKLSSSDKKLMLLIESGNRIHTTEFDWPKNMMPSGFSMKCRKHLKNKRLVYAKQLGVDRIVDFCFGYNEASCHLIVELYDRGNIVLTDHQYTILQLLRVRKDNEDVRFAVRERYPIEKAREAEPLITIERLKEILQNVKPGEQLKRILNPLFIFGPALLEHCLLEAGFPPNCKVGDDFAMDKDIVRLHDAIKMAETVMTDVSNGLEKGYIVQKKEKSTAGNELLTYTEFHPYLFKQHQDSPFIEFVSFQKAVDEFFSKLESQKLDLRTLQLEKNALKKLENVRLDHHKRLDALQKSQDTGLNKAALIELNLPLVDQAIKVVNSAIANQIDWEEISNIVKEAQEQGDPVACSIKELKLETNQITMKLKNPYDNESQESSSDEEADSSRSKKKKKQDFILVDISLGCTAFSNARQYHDKRRHAAGKEQKTIDASKKALKSAEKKTKQTLKEVATSAVINKARKQYWFEKFLWFVSSDNYLLIAGRDQQQNELLVKRYLKPGDLYVHADLHGASSVILKNPTGQPVPPRTLNEAGTMAICYSAAWQARVVTSAWWVFHHQVSKTAPSGEYLTTGSFMIRGKKNYLPPSYLMMGFGIMFKLDETSVGNHLNERMPKHIEDESETFKEDSSANPDEQEDEIDLLEEIDEADEMSRDSPTIPDIVENLTDEDDEEDSSQYPDTSLQLKFVSGGNFELKVDSRAAKSTDNSDGMIDFGDGEKVFIGEKQETQGKPRLSAKQRRDLKKKSKGANEISVTEENNRADSVASTGKKQKQNLQECTQSEQPSSQKVSKRGQKGKLKKMKEKYKDQDEEDKEMIMQLLGSAGDAKEAKSKKKGKKGSKQVQQQRPQSGKGAKKVQEQPLILTSEITESDEITIPTESSTSTMSALTDETVEDEEDGAANEELDKENVSVLDTLTACPIPEDLLLFAIPVCAPYSTMQNYKYKVKVTPGTGRKGKAAKTALHLFSTSKEATQREKDLFRSLKDVDVSRNIPGKVKISAPNLQKSKK
ncbi:ribosome quality control complex subunit NEMF-like [Rhopilema esculentum]|uniref:ribosome quality control complex subunit NEMF-like n=1 Tax=Rhopilema esculentum TaxID=499914 RepID=UPI0031D1C0F2|eukprot:gene3220-1538_t